MSNSHESIEENSQGLSGFPSKQHNKCPTNCITFPACNVEKGFINMINVQAHFPHFLPDLLIYVS